MRPIGVQLEAVAFDVKSRVEHRKEPMLVEASVAKLAAESLLVSCAFCTGSPSTLALSSNSLRRFWGSDELNRAGNTGAAPCENLKPRRKPAPVDSVPTSASAPCGSYGCPTTPSGVAAIAAIAPNLGGNRRRCAGGSVTRRRTPANGLARGRPTRRSSKRSSREYGVQAHQSSSP